MKGIAAICAVLAVACVQCGTDNEPEKQVVEPVSIPLPEHPRPDFERPDWLNLNGQWDFALDSLNVGLDQAWFFGETAFPEKITVPFSWAAPLSGIGRDDIHSGWYKRTLDVPPEWDGRLTYLVIGASDCVTTVWVNGEEAGVHEGGYTPFEFDITGYLRTGEENKLVVHVEDAPKESRFVGKQVYGQAKGIWQTVYIEPRDSLHVVRALFTPDVKYKRVKIDAQLSKSVGLDTELEVVFDDKSVPAVKKPVLPGRSDIGFDIPIPEPHLWELDNPYLYYADVIVYSDGSEVDRVRTYFGMRTITADYLPNSRHMYVTLNDKPVYLKMALDQSYHPEGYYTFPSDDFMREEIQRALDIGLNGLRIHIKAEVPRKLYWADRMGLLIMQDIPNIGGPPNEYGRKNWEYTALSQFDRDYNHPCIFSYVLFNETWGLVTGDQGYTKETQGWVKSMYSWAKELNPGRLIEDNSPDQGRRWHVITDINSWHAYLPGYKWAEYMDDVVRNTYVGSPWNYIEPYVQDNAPMMNSECGNVWGYRGGTGDVDIAYEYHIMMNEYRRRPKICGFIFTEFHDVINEWNGYYRYDRSPKEWGLDELCPGMTVSDFHADMYVIPGADSVSAVDPGAEFAVPLKGSFLSDRHTGPLAVNWALHGWNRLGEHKTYSEGRLDFTTEYAYGTPQLDSLKLTAPEEECLAVLTTTLVDTTGTVLHHNFMAVPVFPDSSTWTGATNKRTVLRVAPDSLAAADWSVRTKSVMGGLKVWGTGTGAFEYVFGWPEKLNTADVDSVTFIAELSSRQVQGKDMEGEFVRQSISDVTERGIDPGHNPNSYPMTDETKHPSVVTISANGVAAGTVTLPDDPADHRGLLSWINQREDGTLDEAGSYGYLARVTLPADVLSNVAETGEVRIRLAVDEASETSGGLAVYGSRFGRYPVDPTLIINRK